MPTITELVSTLQTLFGQRANWVARRTKLVQRDSKLTGAIMVGLLVTGFTQKPTASWGDLEGVDIIYRI